MIPIIIVLSVISQYSPGVMETVVDNRQSGKAWVGLPENLPETDGFIAVRDCSEIGSVWYVQNPNNGNWESFLVADCAMPTGTDGAAEWMEENNVAMEVGYKTAERWGMVGRGFKTCWTKTKPQGMALESHVCQ